MVFCVFFASKNRMMTFYLISHSSIHPYICFRNTIGHVIKKRHRVFYCKTLGRLNCESQRIHDTFYRNGYA